MNPNEATVHGTRPLFYCDIEQPGTTSNIISVNSVSSLCSDYDRDRQLIHVPGSIPESDAALCDIQCISGMCHIDPVTLPIFTEFQQQHSLSDDSNPWNDILAPPVGTECDYGSPVSTFTYRTVSSMSEQGDEAEGLYSMEGGAPAKSMNAPIGNHTGSFIHPGVSGLLAEEMRFPPRTCTGCARPASAFHDHPLTASEVVRRQWFKGVKKKKNKWTCEIRISKKIRKDASLKSKLWLGTFDSPEAAARALHVGRFLLSEKKKKQTDNIANFDQNSKIILSRCKDSLREKTLNADLLQEVLKLANGYGKNGSLPSSGLFFE